MAQCRNLLCHEVIILSFAAFGILLFNVCAYFAARVFFDLSPDSADDLRTGAFFAAVMDAVFDAFSVGLAAALTDLDVVFFAGFSSVADFCAVRVRVVFLAAGFAGAFPLWFWVAGVRFFGADVFGSAVCSPSSCFGASGASGGAGFPAAAAVSLGVTAFFFATASTVLGTS